MREVVAQFLISAVFVATVATVANSTNATLGLPEALAQLDGVPFKDGTDSDFYTSLKAEEKK
jgi:hypothetical protein